MLFHEKAVEVMPSKTQTVGEPITRFKSKSKIKITLQNVRFPIFHLVAAKIIFDVLHTSSPFVVSPSLGNLFSFQLNSKQRPLLVQWLAGMNKALHPPEPAVGASDGQR